MVQRVWGRSPQPIPDCGHAAAVSGPATSTRFPRAIRVGGRHLEACSARRASSRCRRGPQFVYLSAPFSAVCRGLSENTYPTSRFAIHVRFQDQGSVGNPAERTAGQQVLLEKPEAPSAIEPFVGRSDAGVSMRQLETDSLLYAMDMATRRVKQITFPIVKDAKPLHVADCEPTFRRMACIVSRRRDVHISDCWYARRDICARCRRRQCPPPDRDQLMNNPRCLRTAGLSSPMGIQRPQRLFTHPLISMNPTARADRILRNNSMFPAASSTPRHPDRQRLP